MVQTAKARADRVLRVGVVGVGVMGSNHARVLADLPGVKLVGVADPDRKRRDRVANALGCETFSGDRWAARGRRRRGDDRGAHPSASRPGAHLHRPRRARPGREADRLLGRGRQRDHRGGAQRAGVTLMVGHVERFNPAVEAIKDAIRDEDILSIAITRVGPFPPRMSNVGVVIDLAVHDIDLIRWFTDSEIVEVQPQLSSAVAEREDIALLQFRTASGVLAHINTNWLTPFKARNVHDRDAQQVRHGRSADAAGDRMLRLPARRQLFDAASVGRPRRAAARRAAGLRHRDPQRHRRRRSPARKASRASRSPSAASTASRSRAWRNAGRFPVGSRG